MSDLMAVDIGNSALRVGHYGQPPSTSPARIWRTPTTPLDLSGLAEWLPREACRWFISSVRRTATDELIAWLLRNRPADRQRLLGYRDFPLAINVDQPAHVGVDRLAAAVAADALREPGQGAIVVDAGTAVTIDLLTPDGTFQGGVIFPGRRLCSSALALADLLPTVDHGGVREPPAIPGKSTVGAIQAGVFWSHVGAIRDIVARIRRSLPGDALLIMTGRDLEHTADLVEPSGRYRPSLVLAGVALAARRIDPE
jgi:type III pantothenate kinase